MKYLFQLTEDKAVLVEAFDLHIEEYLDSKGIPVKTTIKILDKNKNVVGFFSDPLGFWEAE